MTLISVLDQVAAGLRIALAILAVLILKTRSDVSPDVPDDTPMLTIQRNSDAWALVALAVLALSPLRALVLFHHPVVKSVTRTAEITATFLTCWAFIRVLASRALLRGVSTGRIVSGQRLLWGVVALSLIASGVVG